MSRVRRRQGSLSVATYVLVHGAGDVGASWRLVAAELRGRGHDAVAPDLPCEDDSAGLWDYADTVVEAIGPRTELVVVTHSLGGFTAPLVCERVPVDLMVMVAAMIPSPGETANDWWSTTGHNEAWKAQGLDDTSANTLYYHDVPPGLAAEMSALERDQSGTAMAEPWPLQSWPDVPTRYLLCREDRMFPADWARRHARERLGIAADEIDGGHCPYLSRPKELAGRLVDYAATGARDSTSS
jgi:pimeloyl-ACP methyl ester carboxylesterase